MIPRRVSELSHSFPMTYVNELHQLNYVEQIRSQTASSRSFLDIGQTATHSDHMHNKKPFDNEEKIVSNFQELSISKEDKANNNCGLAALLFSLLLQRKTIIFVCNVQNFFVKLFLFNMKEHIR